MPLFSFAFGAAENIGKRRDEHVNIHAWDVMLTHYYLPKPLEGLYQAVNHMLPLYWQDLTRCFQQVTYPILSSS